MASTRLPGKPLADIWRRADDRPCLAARDRGRRRPGGGRDRRRARRLARSRAAGGRAVMTRADHPSGSDRIFEALGAIDPEGAYDVVVNVQGDLPTIERSAVRACLAPLDDAAVDIATLATPIVRDAGEGRSQRRQGGRRRDRAAPAAGALLHPRPRAVGRGRASAPHRPLRLSAQRAARFVALPPSPLERRERLEQLARARSRHAHRHRARRYAAARRRHARTIWSGRARCSPRGPMR